MSNRIRSGLNTNAYLGVAAASPPNLVKEKRAPTVHDRRAYLLGDLWLDEVTLNLYMLVRLTYNHATWILLVGAAGNITNLRADDGGIAIPDVLHAITMAGGDNIYTTSAANTIIVNLDDRLTNDGEVLIANGIGGAAWNTLTEGLGIHIVNAPNSITISADTIIGLRANAGGVALPDAGNVINVVGSEVITTVTTPNTVTANLTRGTDGQVIIGSSVGPAAWANLTAGAGIGFTIGNNYLRINNVAVGGNLTLTGDVNNAVSAGGMINVLGGANIITIGDLANTFRIHLDQSITLPDTNAAGTQGLYTLGITEFMSNYGGNAFLGGSGNRTTTGTDNTFLGTDAATTITTGSHNTALGQDALGTITSGNYNVALGDRSGVNITTEHSNILIANGGVIGDAHTLRIGDPLVLNQEIHSVYIDGIYQELVAPGYEFGVVDAVDKLGTIDLDDLKFYIKAGYVTKIAVGALHACILTSEGTVYCVGDNQYGQIGNGTTSDTSAWTRVLGQGTGGVTDIACGSYHTVIVKSGVGYSFGLNTNGQLGTNNTTSYSIPTAMTGPGTAGITAVSCGDAFTSVIIAGALYATGLNSEGQLGDNTVVQKVQLTAAAAPADAGVTALACGAYHTVILKTNTMYACGRGLEGQLGDNTATQRNLMTAAAAPGDAGVTAISAGRYHTAVLKTDAMFACGRGLDGALGDNTATQRNLLTAAVAPANAGVTALSCGKNHTSLRKLAVGYGTGLNTDGSIGDNSVVQRNLATAMTSEGTAGLGLIASGNMANTTYATKNGIVFATGDNSNGQISDGTLVDRDELTRSVV